MPTAITARMLRRLGVPAGSFDAELEKMMRAGLDRLLRFQHASGGWGWYCEDGDDAFMTARVVDGLAACHSLGYDVDDVALERGRARVRAYLEDETDLDRRAYFAYALREGFEPLVARAGELSPLALSLVALASARGGSSEAARLAELLARRAEGDHWWARDWFGRWPEVDVLATAYAIRALHAIDPGHPRIGPAVEWLLSRREGGRWRSTMETAIAIEALLEGIDLERLAGSVGAEEREGKRPELLRRVGVRLDGGEPRELLIDLNDPTASVFESTFDRLEPGPHTLAFHALDREAELAFELELATVAVEPAGGPASHGVSVARETDRPLEGLRIGDEVEVALVLRADSPADYVLVRSPVPAGCEVVRGSGTGEFDEFEARGDAALFFVGRLGTEPVRLTYRMKALHAGRYAVLPAWAGRMYDESVGGWTGVGEARIGD